MKSPPPVARPISAFMLLMVAPFAAFGQAPRLPAIAPSPAFRISGTVVDASAGTPLAKTTVFIFPSGDRSVANMKTVRAGPGGHFIFESLHPGKYILQAERRGYRQQAFEGHDNYSTAIAVGPGLQSENLLFRLRLDAAISGRVLDEQNDAVRNARVSLYESQTIRGNPRTSLRGNAMSDDEGSFSFDHLALGKYLVAVSAVLWYAERTQPIPRFRPPNSPDAPVESPADKMSELDVAYPIVFYPAASDPSRALPMALSAGSHETADIVLRAVPALHLRFSKLNSAPISNVIVKQQFQGNEILVNARTIRYENDFEITGLAPGHYLFEVQTNSPGAMSRHEVDAIGDGDIDLGSSLPDAMVTGSVTLEGSPLLLRNTFIQLQGESRVFGGDISPEGKVKFRQPVPPGRYTVRIGGPGVFIIKSLTATGATVSGQTIQITGQSAVNLEIALFKSLAQIDGVVLEGDKPVSGAMVLLVSENPAENFPLFRRDQSDSDGTFTLQAIAPGKYELLAIKNGWDMDWESPAALKPYMKKAQRMRVEGEKYQVKVKVQASAP